MVLGIDSVTDVVIIGSVSGGPMGKEPGKDGAIDPIVLAADGEVECFGLERFQGGQQVGQCCISKG